MKSTQLKKERETVENKVLQTFRVREVNPLRMRDGIECKKQASLYITMNTGHYCLDESDDDSQVSNQGNASGRQQPMQYGHVLTVD